MSRHLTFTIHWLLATLSGWVIGGLLLGGALLRLQTKLALHGAPVPPGLVQVSAFLLITNLAGAAQSLVLAERTRVPAVAWLAATVAGTAAGWAIWAAQPVMLGYPVGVALVGGVAAVAQTWVLRGAARLFWFWAPAAAAISLLGVLPIWEPSVLLVGVLAGALGGVALLALLPAPAAP